MLTTLSLIEAIEQHRSRLEILRRPNGGFQAWMDNPQVEDRALLWTVEGKILGWAVARWYPAEKWAWRKRYGKRTWTLLNQENRWILGWFVDPDYRRQGIMHHLSAILTDDLETIYVQPNDPAVTSVCLSQGWTCVRVGTAEPWVFGHWTKASKQDCSKSLLEFPSDCLPLP